ncbi:MAG: succinate dehydrogenase, cytochrome b556 subunit [Acidimicrobiales bacterium]
MSVTEGSTDPRSAGPERSSEPNHGRRPYRGRSGQWAFVGHRVSGFLVFFFLLLHIVDVSLVRWPATYDDVHAVYGNVVLRLFEVGLLFALVFHSLNGLRIVAVDFFPRAVKNERRLLSAVVVMTLLLGVPGAWVIMLPFVRGHF